MKLLLMAAVPCKRFDFAPRCDDGRGGWTFSQFGADRYVARPTHHKIKLGLAAWIEPAVPNDYLESTKLIAISNGSPIGSNVLEWRRPNNGGSHHSAGSVFEWIQDVDAPIETDGLVEIAIQLKLNSRADYLAVNGCAYVHVTCRDTNSELVTPDEYVESLDDETQSFAW